MRFLLALALSAVLAPATASANPARSLTRTGIPGAVVLDHAGLHAAGDVRAGSRFRVGSITKTFVAVVTLQLVTEGKLSLDEPVPEARDVPLRTLLNHTSGLFNHSDDPRVFADGLLTRWRPEQLLAISLEHPPYFAPGGGFHYANTNYVVLGLVIERVTGHSLVHELERRIIRPLKLRDTAYEEGPRVRNLAPGPRQNTSWAGASGAMVSTARDLGRFFRSLPPVLRTGGDPYGFGLFKVPTTCGEAWGHNGAVPGYLSHAYVAGRRQVVVLVDRQPLTARQDAAVNRVLNAALCP